MEVVVLSLSGMETRLGASDVATIGVVCPGGAPANMTSPPWSHSSSHSAETVTSAAMNGLRNAVYSTGAVDVSREGGFLHKSVFGGAASVNDPIYSGTTSFGTLRAVKEELAGGISKLRCRSNAPDVCCSSYTLNNQSVPRHETLRVYEKRLTVLGLCSRTRIASIRNGRLVWVVSPGPGGHLLCCGRLQQGYYM